MFLAVTNFSFVSSKLGIPFATNVGALTVTKCASAARYVKVALMLHVCVNGKYFSHSCSQCLQTDNACGWCIYNKVCSGTSAPCTSETNWLQVSGLRIHACCSCMAVMTCFVLYTAQ